MKRMTSNIGRPTLIAAVTVGALLSPFASAEARDRSSERYTTYGKVIRAEPIYREVTVRVPTEHCWIEEEHYEVQEGHSNHHKNRYRNSRSRRNGRSSGDTVAGTVIGGVIGNQLGRNGGRGARAGATIAGAIIGSVIANEVGGSRRGSGNSHRRHRQHDYNTYEHAPARGSSYGARPVERCETVFKNSIERRIEGYNVTYIHRGRRLHTRTRKDPGSRIALTAVVAPARRQ